MKILAALVLAGVLAFGTTAMAEEFHTDVAAADDVVTDEIVDGGLIESGVDGNEAADSGSVGEESALVQESGDTNDGSENAESGNTGTAEDYGVPDGLFEEDTEDDLDSAENEIDGSAEDFDPDDALLAYMNSFFPKKTSIGGPHHVARIDKENLLGEKEKVIYRSVLSDVQEKLVKGLQSQAIFKINVSGNVAFSDDKSIDLNQIQYALLYDHPELFFWYGRKCKASRKGSVWTVKLQVGPSYRPEGSSDVYAVDTARVQAVTTASANASAVVTAAAGKGDYEKLEYYLSYVDNANVYNSAASVNTDPNKIDDFDPWEIIYVFDGDPDTNVVCEGYAKAFKYLCDKSVWSDDPGLSCYVAGGCISTNPDSITSAHMWNIVQTRDRSFLVDPTWCDTNSGAGYSLRQFMVGGTKQSEHTWKITRDSLSPVYYLYNENTLKLYDEAELTLSRLDYPEDVSHTHTWDQGNVTVAPTCLQTGVRVYTCTLCDRQRSEDIAKLDHKWDSGKVTTPAGCTADGVLTYICQVGQETRTEVIPATGHAWTSQVTTPATCTEAGVRTYTCQNCGEEYTEEIPATGHSWKNSWTLTQAPTALAEGLETDTCENDSAHTRSRLVAKLPGTLSLNAYTVPLRIKQKSSAVYVYGLAAGDYVVSATSSKTKIVKAKAISGNRIYLRGRKKGTATVTVKLASGVTASLKVKVRKAKVTTRKISIACARTLYIPKGSKVSIGAVLTPVTSQDKIKYSSSKKKVASVSKSGVITARRAGKATIKVRSGKKIVKIRVRVY